MKAAFIIAISLLLYGGALAQTPVLMPSTGIEEVYLAKDDGEGKAGEQVTEFRTTDIPIYCVILLESNKQAIVKMNFVAVSVAGVKPETKVVTSSYTTKGGQNRVNFTGHPEGKWTAGKYRVDLFLDGSLVATIEPTSAESQSAGVELRMPAGRRHLVATHPDGQRVADEEIRLESGSRA